jgi:hypothetical protein
MFLLKVREKYFTTMRSERGNSTRRSLILVNEIEEQTAELKSNYLNTSNNNNDTNKNNIRDSSRVFKYKTVKTISVKNATVSKNESITESS